MPQCRDGRVLGAKGAETKVGRPALKPPRSRRHSGRVFRIETAIEPMIEKILAVAESLRIVWATSGVPGKSLNAQRARYHMKGDYTYT